jgi:hypothetical protein
MTLVCRHFPQVHGLLFDDLVEKSLDVAQAAEKRKEEAVDELYDTIVDACVEFEMEIDEMQNKAIILANELEELAQAHKQEPPTLH